LCQEETHAQQQTATILDPLLRRRNRRQTVSRKIASTAKALSISGFDMKYSAGGLSHERIMRCISLYGEKVIPLVREMLAS
jgi:hypothetical protein